MNAQPIEQLKNYEQILAHILRDLPLERVSQVVDFARFMAAQAEKSLIEETAAEIRASEEKWDALFAQPAAQSLMWQLAQEALAEDDLGLTMEMVFDKEGNLVEPV